MVSLSFFEYDDGNTPLHSRNSFFLLMFFFFCSEQAQHRPQQYEERKSKEKSYKKKEGEKQKARQGFRMFRPPVEVYRAFKNRVQTRSS